MNTICIYCKNTDPNEFVGREHVLPQSFGKFGSKTPTLHCVCDNCNAYFKKELDQELARETLEGVTRYKHGIFSREKRFPKNLRFALEETDEHGDFAGALLSGYNPLTGAPPLLIPQFWIRNIKKNEWERYALKDIKNIQINDEEYGPSTPGSRQMRILAPSKTEYDTVIQELKKCNIPYREKEMIGPPPFLKNSDADGKIEIKGTIHGTITKQIKRALVKALFNFATYYAGKEETLKVEWDKARQFVRYDGDTLLGRMTQEPFWTGQETKQMRFAPNSYNLRIENKNSNVNGVIQLYNLFTYEFILAENYSISPEKEVAYRFTPGQEPFLGIKLELKNN